MKIKVIESFKGDRASYQVLMAQYHAVFGEPNPSSATVCPSSDHLRDEPWLFYIHRPVPQHEMPAKAWGAQDLRALVKRLNRGKPEQFVGGLCSYDAPVRLAQQEIDELRRLVAMAPLRRTEGAPRRPNILDGEIVGIVSGDAVTLLDTTKRRQRVRLAGVNAPDKRQTLGAQARSNLAKMLKGRQVTADCYGLGHGRRLTCKILVQPDHCDICGKTLDVGLAQILAGMALWDRREHNDQSEDARGRYQSAEAQARERRRGVWLESDTEPAKESSHSSAIHRRGTSP